MCRALDAHGFAALKVSILQHVALSAAAGLTEEEGAFLAATPKQLWSTVERCWEVAPTAEQIAKDIHDWPEVLQKIIANEGRIVPEEDCRHGVRKVRSAVTGKELKRRPRKSQKKETNAPPPFHPTLAAHPKVAEQRRKLSEG